MTALSGSSVYVSPEVDGASELAASLTQQVGDASIGVAVFSDNAALEASGPEIVQQLASQTSFDTIVVAVGDDLSAGSRVLEQGEAMRIANEAEGAAGSVDDALTQTVQQVVDELPAGSAGAGADAGLAIGVAVGVAVVVALGGAGLGVFLRLRRRGRRAAPDEVRGSVGKLRALQGEYAATAAAGSSVAAEFADRIGTISGHADELFSRLERKGDGDQRSVAAVEYGETLRRLTAALDRDYLLDIVRRPDLWDDPDERVAEVREAAAAVADQLVENIRQVNARRGLQFQVSLDSLMGGRKELRDWQRAFEKAEGDTGGLPAVGD
ncbi:hypothetical protein GCM10025738_24330 [Microbacterium fluvii]